MLCLGGYLGKENDDDVEDLECESVVEINSFLIESQPSL